MNDSQRIAAAKRGDNEALAQLLHENYLFVFKYLIRVTLHRQTAEDLTQDTMIRAIQKIELYDEKQSKFASWLITIGTHLYLDHRRRTVREHSLLSDDAALRSLHWQMESGQEDWSLLIDALARLPSHTRTAVVLKHYYGYGYDEIAGILKLPPGTVKSRVHHGLTALRKEWADNEKEALSHK